MPERRKRRRKGVNGARKGGSFERKVCKALSLWVTKGKRTDVFWRTGGSGSRATMGHRRGVSIRQTGDITAVAPEGHVFTDKWFVECKNVRNLSLDGFLISNTGPLAKFWIKAQKEAKDHNRLPMIIARANGPVLVIANVGALEHYTSPQLTSHARNCDVSFFSDMTCDVPEAMGPLKKGKKE